MMGAALRASRYLWRKKGKSLILTGCFFVMCTAVLLTGVLVRGTEELQQSLEEKTGSKLILEGKISREQAAQWAELEDVTKVNRGASGVVHPISFSAIIGGDGENSMTLWAYDDTAADGPFAKEQFRLLEGEPIGERRGLLISAHLAQANGISLGDRLTLEGPSGARAEGTVVGLFLSGQERRQDDGAVYSANRLENQVFCDFEYFETLFGEGALSSLSLYAAPTALEKLEEHIRQQAGPGINMTASDTLFRQISAPLRQVGRMAGMLRSLTMALFTLILSLLQGLWMRSRQREFGILRSMGLGGGMLVVQCLLENLLLLIPAGLGAAVTVGKLRQWLWALLFSDPAYAALGTVSLRSGDLGALALRCGAAAAVGLILGMLPSLRESPSEILSKMEE